MTGFAPIAATSLGQSSTNANYQMQVSSGTFTLSMQGAAYLSQTFFLMVYFHTLVTLLA